MRLAVVTSHPIQYQAPWFRAMAASSELDLDVLFCHRATRKDQADAGFEVEFEWDGRLLDGYHHRFLRNVAGEPGVSTFWGTNTPELASLVDAYDAVLVNGWHYLSAWQAIRACWRLRVPVLVRSDSHLRTTRSGWKRIAKELPYRWFIGRFDACLPVGRWSRDYFLHYGADPDRVFTVPHVVDPSLGSRAVELRCVRREVRTRWLLGDEQIVFLFAGKFVPVKRPLDFVQAVDAARSRDSRVRGLMVGDGPMRAECERLAAALDAPVRFTGFLNQSEMPAAYAASDALVLPSESETWGLVVNEAMASGLPCIVSEGVGCRPDLISDSTGRTFPAGDVAALAAQLLACSSNPGTFRAMGERSRGRIEASLAQSVYGVRDAVLASMIRRPRPKSSTARVQEAAHHG